MNCNPFQECGIPENSGRKKIVVLKDAKSKTQSTYRYENAENNHLETIKVEDCVMQQRKQTDFLLLNCDKKKSFYV
jgi:hypothetical protein